MQQQPERYTWFKRKKTTDNNKNTEIKPSAKFTAKLSDNPVKNKVNRAGFKSTQICEG